MGPVVLEHMADELVVAKQEGFGLAVLRHKVDTLVALGHRDFVPDDLGQ